MAHIPVLLNEVMEYLDVHPGRRYIDATLNGGGHTTAIAERGGIVLGIEWDPVIVGETEEKFSALPFRDQITIVNDSYINIASLAEKKNLVPDGIIFDLGLSSWHYESSGRGFSFKRDEPLDMRFNTRSGIPASEIVNLYDRAELEQIIRDYGEEKFSYQIADAVCNERKKKPIMTTAQLVAVIEGAVPGWYRHQKIHCATKTFQALRVVVNDELGNVTKGIQAALKILKPGGRLVVISFQGQEDKLVREIFKEHAKQKDIKLPAGQTIRPEWEEQKSNPRSRSAKMKVAEKI